MVSEISMVAKKILSMVVWQVSITSFCLTTAFFSSTFYHTYSICDLDSFLFLLTFADDKKIIKNCFHERMFLWKDCCLWRQSPFPILIHFIVMLRLLTYNKVPIHLVIMFCNVWLNNLEAITHLSYDNNDWITRKCVIVTLTNWLSKTNFDVN